MRRIAHHDNLLTDNRAEVNPKNMELLEEFCIYMKSCSKSENTIKRYSEDIILFFCWMERNLDNKPFNELTKREFIRFMNEAVNEWHWSPNRFHSVRAALSSMSNYIETILDDEEEYKDFRNIIAKIPCASSKSVIEKTVWEKEELEGLLSLLTAMGRNRQACFVALAMYSGRRISELCRFKVKDFEDNRIVCNGKLYKSSPIKTKGREGGKMLNCYTLVDKFKPYLEKWMEQRRESGITSEWLFPDENGEQISVAAVRGWTRSFTNMSGKDFYFHSLRHFYTTSLVREGIPDRIVQKIVGWESTDMVDRYVDTSVEEQIGEWF